MKQPVEKKEAQPQQLPIVVHVKWIDAMRFVASDDKGHATVMDVPKEAGGEGSGFGPMQLLLVALGGCTGIDVVDIMRKQQQQLEGLEIVVSGERASEHPRVYDKIHVEYRVKGKDLKERAVQRAIELSEQKYCSVEAMLRAKANATSSYTIQQT